MLKPKKRAIRCNINAKKQVLKLEIKEADYGERKREHMENLCTACEEQDIDFNSDNYHGLIY